MTGPSYIYAVLSTWDQPQLQVDFAKSFRKPSRLDYETARADWITKIWGWTMKSTQRVSQKSPARNSCILVRYKHLLTWPPMTSSKTTWHSDFEWKLFSGQFYSRLCLPHWLQKCAGWVCKMLMPFQNLHLCAVHFYCSLFCSKQWSRTPFCSLILFWEYTTCTIVYVLLLLVQHIQFVRWSSWQKRCCQTQSLRVCSDVVVLYIFWIVY